MNIVLVITTAINTFRAVYRQRRFAVGMTAYGGGIVVGRLQRFSSGAWENFGTIGAVSVDVTQAKSQLRNNEKRKASLIASLFEKVLRAALDLRLLGYKILNQRLPHLP